MAYIDDEEYLNQVATQLAVEEAIITQEEFNTDLYNRLLQKRTLLFNDTCDVNIVEKFIMPLLEMDNDGTGKKITIYISTNGGSVYDTLPVCNIIEKLKTETDIIVLGYMYSMGSLILMSGYNNEKVTRYCYPFSTGLIHGGSNYISGTAKQVKDYYKFNERFEAKITKFILSHTNDNFTEKDYQQIDDGKEAYLDADEMLHIGLVDKIL